MRSSSDIFNNHLNSLFSGKAFEKMYMASREKENRVYSDEQVAQLPFIEPFHIHYDEWQVRSRSASRLIHYLKNKNRPLSILEVGCGNGWLSGRLAALENSSVTGIDINGTELDQAIRVFGGKVNMHFSMGDLRNIEFDKKFDAIVFAASIQYFPFFDQTVGHALSLLNQAGEIHILDSHFYHNNKVKQAKQRSHSYYQSIGYEEMAEFYFQHVFLSLKDFHHKILFNPYKLKNKIFGKNDPFPWICITTT